MDEDVFMIVVIIVAVLVAVLVGGTIDYDNENNRRDDSIACVKAGGTWSESKDVCLNK